MGFVLWLIYLALLVASFIIVGRIVYLQFFWTPEAKIAEPLTPKSTHRVLEPVRGNIYDCKGRLLAMSYPIYTIRLDCTVGEDDKWLKKARELSLRLPEFFPGKTANEYFRYLVSSRTKGKKYLQIGKPVDHSTLQELKKLPLLSDGRNRGGLIIEQSNIRKYPYGKLARRTIGFVRDNKPGVRNNAVGIEGGFDKILHGKDGSIWMRQTDKGRSVRNNDSTFVEAVDGQSIQSTLDIDYQEIADNALRAGINGESELEAACLVLMDVETGAIRAMVNLTRDAKTGRFEEISNIAVGRRHEPGSVFKTVTLAALLKENRIRSLGQTLPTNHGNVTGTKHKDHHIIEYEQKHHKNRISILEGLAISSNYVFATLAVQNYGEDPQKYVDAIHGFHLDEKFDFDLAGLQKPYIPGPKDRYFTPTDLGSMGFGYTTEETPLHMLTFYNAIAGGGRMMKPYLVSDRGPVVLDTRVFSKAVADTLTRALKYVVTDGTGRAAKNAKAQIAGKTGTSFATFQVQTPKGKRAVYVDSQGRRKYQGTFVGFFPADSPKYSIICCVYSRPTKKSYQGGGIPARTVTEVVNRLYEIDPYWQMEI